MAEFSNIEWCEHTFNPYRGCRKVSPGCRFCYADLRSSRFGEDFSGQRILLSKSGWSQPIRWNALAATYRKIFHNMNLQGDSFDLNDVCGILPSLGSDAAKRLSEMEKIGYIKSNKDGRYETVSYHPPRVFCASLADVFESWTGGVVDHFGNPLFYDESSDACHIENQFFGDCDYDRLELDHIRKWLFNLIDATTELDWLLLTKRPENILEMWPSKVNGKRYRHNVWIGTSSESQEWADLRIPIIEPLNEICAVRFISAEPLLGEIDLEDKLIDWVVAGGESGPKARPADLNWFRLLRDQCEMEKVPFLFKQWGEWSPHGSLAPGTEGDFAMFCEGSTVRIKNYPRPFETFGSCVMTRVGKKKAGRLLDGVEHNEFPIVEGRFSDASIYSA